jgi:hypothetical protein
MRKIPLQIIMVALLVACLLPAIASADQTLPFAPLGNTTGAYQIYQGNDWWEINTNVPITVSDNCYPEEVWLAIVGIGVAFIFLAAVFIARSDNVPSIGILLCGLIAFGVELAASEMAPLVGYVKTFSQVIPTVGSSGAVTLNATNTVYLNSVVIYTTSPWMSYACWGFAVVGIVIAIAGTLSFFGVFQRKGLSQAQKGNYLEQDVDGQDPEAIRFREREERRSR